MPSGKIKHWRDDKGFGFIAPDDGGNDVFFHISGLVDGCAEVGKGQAVKYELGADKKSGRPKAIAVDLV